MNNEFWAFSIATYAAEGVADRCLRIQDETGLDVNLLLYACWLASLGRQLTPAHLAAIETLVGPWRQRVVQPLRALRRELRDYPEAAALREKIKALELQSERQQQDRMWEYFQSAPLLPLADGTLVANIGLLAEDIEVNRALWDSLSECLAALIVR